MEYTKLAKIEKALKLIQGHYREPLNIDELSASVNMSSSAFHRAFKTVTAASPIQYIKKITLLANRLNLNSTNKHTQKMGFFKSGKVYQEE